MMSVSTAAKATIAAALLAAPQGSELSPRSAASLDGYGDAVEVGARDVFVGAWTDPSEAGRSGVVHVFEPADGAWRESAVLAPRSPAPEQQFGASLAVDGDTLLVGAPGDPVGGRGAGAVYVFERDGGAWRQTVKLRNGRRFEQLGWSVAIDGDRALVGAIGYDAVGRGTGAAYVFERSDSRWRLVARLTASDASRGALFGHSVALEGDVALVGANRDGAAAYRARGAVYVFERGSGPGDWPEVAKLVPPVASWRSRFGHTLDLNGGIAVVGDRFGVPGGAAHVYVRGPGENGGWEHAAILRSPSAHASEFGWAVDVEGDSILVGDRFDAGEGAVTCFLRDAGSGWTARALLRRPRGAMERGFGFAVGQGAGRAVIGVTTQEAEEPGAAFAFPLPVRSELRPLAWDAPSASGPDARGGDSVWICGRRTAGVGFLALRPAVPVTPFASGGLAIDRTGWRRSPVSPGVAAALIHSLSVSSHPGIHGPLASGSTLLVESWSRPAAGASLATFVTTTLEGSGP